MELLELPKSAFLGLVEGFLKEDYRLNLIVEGLTAKKEIGCSAQYCTEILTVASPDDVHIEIAREKPKEGECVEREYKCGKVPSMQQVPHSGTRRRALLQSRDQTS